MADKSSRPAKRGKRPRALTPEERAELNLALEEEQEEGPILPDSSEEAAADLGTRSPISWRLVGLLALLLLVIVLLAIEWVTGGSNTSVAPGSPSTPPRVSR